MREARKGVFSRGKPRCVQPSSPWSAHDLALACTRQGRRSRARQILVAQGALGVRHLVAIHTTARHERHADHRDLLDRRPGSRPGRRRLGRHGYRLRPHVNRPSTAHQPPDTTNTAMEGGRGLVTSLQMVGPLSTVSPVTPIVRSVVSIALDTSPIRFRQITIWQDTVPRSRPHSTDFSGRECHRSSKASRGKDLEAE